VDATVSINNPLTTLLCFGTTPQIESSHYIINSILSSEQQAMKMFNIGRKHQRYLALLRCSTK